MSLAQRLNKRVLLQQRVKAKDAAGQPVETWVNVVATGDGKIWAEILDTSGREFIAAGAPQNKVFSTITIRERNGVAPDMRVLHNADVYEINAVLMRTDGGMTLVSERIVK